MEIKITEKDTNDLIEYANEIPTKYGLPILTWLNNLKNGKDSTRKKDK
jgi:uncharacterized FlaG/YvyC family protein|tara:strand:+ start:205 stop:348 length:144 start_codon:yes stop_codon:yes gene_type:complete